MAANDIPHKGEIKYLLDNLDVHMLLGPFQTRMRTVTAAEIALTRELNLINKHRSPGSASFTYLLKLSVPVSHCRKRDTAFTSSIRFGASLIKTCLSFPEDQCIVIFKDAFSYQDLFKLDNRPYQRKVFLVVAQIKSIKNPVDEKSE